MAKLTKLDDIVSLPASKKAMRHVRPRGQMLKLIKHQPINMDTLHTCPKSNRSSLRRLSFNFRWDALQFPSK